VKKERRREISLCASRPPRRSEAGRKSSACSARNDGGGRGEKRIPSDEVGIFGRCARDDKWGEKRTARRQRRLLNFPTGQRG
jgi:hypothetical protein